MTRLNQKLDACANSYRGGNPSPCKNDWCKRCSQENTNQLVAEALKMFELTNARLYHDTAIIGPTYSYQQGVEIALSYLRKMAKLNIKCIGVLEYGDHKETKGWEGINAVKPFYPVCHNGVAHLHFIADNYSEELKDIFPYSKQLLQQMEGVGKWQQQSRKDFIEMTIRYGRKRDRIKDKRWFKSLQDSDQQMAFKIEQGGVYLSRNTGTRWCLIFDMLFQD